MHKVGYLDIKEKVQGIGKVAKKVFSNEDRTRVLYSLALLITPK